MVGIFRKFKERANEREEQKREQSAQRAAYTTAVMALAQPGANVQEILDTLPAAAAFAGQELAQVHTQAFIAIVDVMLEDDVLDEAEETNLLTAGATLGFTTERLNGEFPDLLGRMIVAKVNDGRLPTVAANEVRLPLTTGEVAHLITGASLYKWESVREYKAGFNGVSFRVMKGVYYHAGRTKGRSVVTGQQLVVADSGVLTVTSKRAVFVGSKRSLAFDYKKLLDIEVFSDGLKLAVSNRQVPSLLTTTVGGDVIAAVINAAAGRL